MALGDREIERSLSKAVAAGQKREAERRRSQSTRDEALERADRREWAHARLGSEHRWQETISGPRRTGARRFIYDPAQGVVVEIQP